MSRSSKNILTIDNYDSFTWNLVALLRQGNAKVNLIYNDDETWERIKPSRYDGVVLSPGPGIPATSGFLLKMLERYKEVLPILGVCLGHQAIGEHFGLKVIQAKELCHGKIHKISMDGKGIFSGIPKKVSVVRYHSLAVSEPDDNSELVVTSRTKDGEIMGLRHKKLKIEGVQFHPDSIETRFGQEMINNWLKSI